MSDNGDNSHPADSGITDVTTPEQDHAQMEVDSGYGTVPNSMHNSTETLCNTDSLDSNMDVDDAKSDDSGLNDAPTTAASDAQLTCDGCMKPYDDNAHTIVTGECGHARCNSCWTQHNGLCSTCSKFSDKIRSTIALTRTNVKATEGSKINGTVKTNGVILKDCPSESSGSTATKSTVMPSQPGLSSSASVRIKCMNGVTLQESVNPSKTTVDQTKRMIHQKTGISYERQHLLHKGKTMTDSRTLSSYSVANGSTIQMAERCSGG